jgi:cytochrome c oxidase assembly protein subunit 15
LGGFATVTLLALFSARLNSYRWRLSSAQNDAVNSIKSLAGISLAAVIVQIALGGWTTSNYAALACPDLPLCQNSLWPRMDFEQGFNIFQHIGPNYLGGLMESAARTAIHMTHRIGALVVTILVVITALRLNSVGSTASTFWSRVLLFLLVVQISLGISNVVFALPLAIAVLHNAFGALLLVVLTLINFYMRCPQMAVNDGQVKQS